MFRGNSEFRPTPATCGRALYCTGGEGSSFAERPATSILRNGGTRARWRSQGLRPPHPDQARHRRQRRLSLQTLAAAELRGKSLRWCRRWWWALDRATTPASRGGGRNGGLEPHWGGLLSRKFTRKERASLLAWVLKGTLNFTNPVSDGSFPGRFRTHDNADSMRTLCGLGECLNRRRKLAGSPPSDK